MFCCNYMYKILALEDILKYSINSDIYVCLSISFSLSYFNFQYFLLYSVFIH